VFLQTGNSFGVSLNCNHSDIEENPYIWVLHPSVCFITAGKDIPQTNSIIKSLSGNNKSNPLCAPSSHRDFVANSQYSSMKTHSQQVTLSILCGIPRNHQPRILGARNKYSDFTMHLKTQTFYKLLSQFDY